MLLGAPLQERFADPAAWVAALQARGYRAAYCPVDAQADDATVRAFAAAAERAGVVIAEVGAWSNPLSDDPAERAAALKKCQEQLALADRLGARCCVNIAGSRSQTRWDGPDSRNFDADTFERVVATVREIVDAVQPARTDYTLETMPWIFPDSLENYERLLRAVDRPRFAVHFDPVNLIVSPAVFFAHRALVRDFVDRLGAKVRAVHLKDVRLHGSLPVHLEECAPGLGQLDLPAVLRELDRLAPDTPVLLEHLPGAAEYDAAARAVRAAARQAGVAL
jgi:sugar phosphate isomerase/epimerase